MNNKRRIKMEVKKLAKKKQYDEIFYRYGPKYFRKYVSEDYKVEDINKLKEEGRYREIYDKYGQMHIEKSKKHSKWKFYIGLSLYAFTITRISEPLKRDIGAIKNSYKYEEQIEEYEREIEEYAKEFNIEEQSDLEIIMKCMYDLQNNIQGYGTPKLDIVGYGGLDVAGENGIGVCRNFAPNIVDKLNKININYNARSVLLLQDSGSVMYNNINKTSFDEEYTTKWLGNGKYEMYKEDKLIRTLENREGISINTYYKDDGTIKKYIDSENQRTLETYDIEGNIKEKGIFIGNEETKIIYTREGQVEHKTKIVTENKDGVEYMREYENDVMIVYQEETKDNFKWKQYHNGHVIKKIMANADKQETYYYDQIDGKLKSIVILKDGYETTIEYGDNLEELSNEKVKSNNVNYYISRKETEENNKKMEEDRQREKMLQEQELNELKEKGMGNHEIVAVDIEEDNITLLIDPTNLSLGIYKEGKIIMFNEMKPEEAIYLRASVSAEASFGGIEKFLQYPIDYIKSFNEPTISMEEIEEKYGLDAQNRIIEKIEQQENKKTLRQQLRIDDNTTYDFDDNKVTIIKEAEQENDDIEH
jgi:hypothetical protein